MRTQAIHTHIPYTHAGAPLGSHEGPLRQALAPALPQLSEPVVPAQGRASGGVVTYSKGAALLTMVQQVLDFDQQSMQVRTWMCMYMDVCGWTRTT